MYYEGDNTNKITIGRDMGWGAITSLDVKGNINTTGSINITSTNQVLSWGSRTEDYLIKLYANDYIMYKICCNICIKVYSSKYMTQHKKTLFYLENAYEYYVDGRIEGKFENYFI